MEEITEILQELHPDVDFETNTSLVDDKILDSFDIVAIVTEISNEFNVFVPAEEIIPENFNSAAALSRLVRRLLDE